MANNSIYALSDTLSAVFAAISSTSWHDLYVWQDNAKMNDWRADGYRSRQNGTCSVKCSNGEQLTKTYFRVC